MPRGVYDRSKLKKKGEEKTAAPKTPKAESKKKAFTKVTSVKIESKEAAPQEVGQAFAGHVGSDQFALARISETLLSIRRDASGNNKLVAPIDEALLKIVSKLDSVLSDSSSEIVKEQPAQKEAAPVVTAPVAQPVPVFAPAPIPAPVPFNPPAPSSVQS